MSQARSARFMNEVQLGHWVVNCRICPGKRTSRAHFDSALECHEWWRDHVRSQRHLDNSDPNHYSAADATGHLLREIFGAAPEPHPPIG